jgi:hypothetical protein
MNEKRRIVIISDSSAQVRPEEGMLWQDVYPGMLCLHDFFTVIDHSETSVDTSHFLESRNLHYEIKWADADYFVVHLGICDLSPRLFTKQQKLLLEYLSKISLGHKSLGYKLFIYFLKKRVNIENWSFNAFLYQSKAVRKKPG